ncbi:hypothetical protein MMC07_000799 [Pseudocyphellaria aurata]|nr:hypothetical protein [Pseudocyphellaria aurata]
MALLTQLSHSRGCVTPAQIQNLKDSIEDNLDYLDGYDEIGPELQEKDVDQNRPGNKRVRTSVSKKKQMTENSESDSHRNATSSKPAPKKRSRKKNEDAENEDSSAPPSKKPKHVPRRSKDGEADNADANTLPLKKTKTGSKKTKKAIDSDAGSELDAEAPKSKKDRRKRNKTETQKLNDKVVLEEQSSDDDAAPSSPRRKKQPTRKTAAMQKLQLEPEESGTDPESGSLENIPKSSKARKKIHHSNPAAK